MRPALILITISSLVHAGELIDTAKERELLIHGHPAEQQAAMMRLANSGESGFSILADIIENEKDSTAQGRAGLALQEAATRPENKTNTDFFKRAKRLAENENPNISYHGLQAVAKMKQFPEARKLIKQAAKSRREPKLRALVLGLLLANSENDKAEASFFAEYLKDPSEYVRVWAAGFLGVLGDARALQFINEVLRREPKNTETRFLIMRAAIAAGCIGDSSSLPLLRIIGESANYGIAQEDARQAMKEIEIKNLPTIGDRIKYLETTLYEPAYSRWAAFKLSEFGGADAIAVLQRGAKSKDSAISTESIRTLMAMGAKIPEQ